MKDQGFYLQDIADGRKQFDALVVGHDKEKGRVRINLLRAFEGKVNGMVVWKTISLPLEVALFLAEDIQMKFKKEVANG